VLNIYFYEVTGAAAQGKKITFSHRPLFTGS